MSEDFGARMAQILAAYAEKKQRGQTFTHQWFKATKEVIIPVLNAAKREMGKVVSLDVAEEKDGIVTLTLSPTRNAKKLSFRPKIYDDTIEVTSSVGSESAIPFENLSEGLIESLVEDFLKSALQLKT